MAATFSMASPSPLGIGADSTDEEVMLFLRGRKAEDPLPSNIIAERNPFSFEPGDFHDGMLYLYNSKVDRSCNQGNIFTATRTGFWRSMNDFSIVTNNATIGRKTTLEFYNGQEPFGNRTGWVMHEFHKVETVSQGITAAQDYNSICRVSFQDNQRDLLTSNYAGNSPALSELSKGEYVEILDLRKSTSSSSDNSSFWDDDCFDADALLRDLENGSSQEKQEDLNYKLSIAASKPINVVIGPSHSAGSVENNATSHPVVEEHMPPSNASPPTSDQCASSSSGPSSYTVAVAPQLNANASGFYQQVHPKPTHSAPSESSSSSNGSGSSKSSGRIAKLGKKCCCFAPF